MYDREKNFKILKQKEEQTGNGINTLLMISFFSENEEYHLSQNRNDPRNAKLMKLNHAFYNKFIFCILKGFRIKGIHFTFCSNINDNMLMMNTS